MANLESRDPDQIVKAFEMLTMSAPLRRAAETGRLHIYPIDLRSAAARRLKASADPAEPLADPESGEEDPDAFDEFLNDLMSYLNSVDYLGEFMSDTIRQSSKLCGEIKTNCETHLTGEVKEEEDRIVLRGEVHELILYHGSRRSELNGTLVWLNEPLLPHQRDWVLAERDIR